ncbi:hypothetical protein WJR50_07420 [Catalinimonas sp. 4WD22]|uniref:hypothetical protein n=1 Tax=Catalinimonas locisalis TaxID=3133978 RepID=UPI0031018AA6
MRIRQSQVKDEIETFKIRKEALHNILAPWFSLVEASELSDSDKKKTNDELFILAKFICEFKEPLRIIEGVRECPDFIVSSERKKIGIELSQIILDFEDKQRRGKIENIFKRTEELLNTNKYNAIYGGIYEIEFTSIKIKRKDSLKIVEELKLLFENHHPANLKFIKAVRKTSPHDLITISYGEPWIVGEFDQEILDKAIAKKENKLKYYEDKTIQEQWLLLFTSGIGKAGDFSFINDKTLSKNYNTSFHRIFLFDSMSGTIQKLNEESH